MKDLLSAGQFAKLASTTKRTVTWYDQEEILKPVSIDQSGYRWYKPEQIIDFQVILLLRKLNFSIDQIKEYLSKNTSVKDLFLVKRAALAEEINNLTKKLETIDSYYQNVESDGLFIKPSIKQVKEFSIYYLQKEGPYSKIYQYGLELRSYFKKIPTGSQFLAVYEDLDYKPVRSIFKVGVIIEKGMEIRKEARQLVLQTTLPSFTALSYTHNGSPSLLSFHWKQLEKYASLHEIQQNKKISFADIEIYKKNGFVENTPEDQVVTEMLLPIIA